MKIIVKQIFQTSNEKIIRVLIQKIDKTGNIIISGFAVIKRNAKIVKNLILAENDDTDYFIFVKVYDPIKTKRFHFEVYDIRKHPNTKKLAKAANTPSYSKNAILIHPIINN